MHQFDQIKQNTKDPNTPIFNLQQQIQQSQQHSKNSNIDSQQNFLNNFNNFPDFQKNKTQEQLNQNQNQSQNFQIKNNNNNQNEGQFQNNDNFSEGSFNPKQIQFQNNQNITPSNQTNNNSFLEYHYSNNKDQIKDDISQKYLEQQTVNQIKNLTFADQVSATSSFVNKQGSNNINNQNLQYKTTQQNQSQFQQLQNNKNVFLGDNYQRQQTLHEVSIMQNDEIESNQTNQQKKIEMQNINDASFKSQNNFNSNLNLQKFREEELKLNYEGMPKIKLNSEFDNQGKSLKQQNDLVPLSSSNKQSSKILQKSFRNSGWKWVVLFFISIYSLASYYGLQVPSPLQDQFMEDYNISQTQYNNLFVMFALPNIVLPLLTGPLSQKIGLQTAFLFYTLVMMGGAYLQYLSSLDSSYILLSIGTVLFGIGVNGSVVLINSFTCLWFIGSELSTALALINAIQYFGQVLASLILSPLYNVNKNMETPLFYSFLIIVLCFISFIFMAILEKYAQKKDKENGIQIENDEEEEEIINLKDIKGFGKLFWFICICVFLAYACLCYNNNIESLLVTNYSLSGITAGQIIALQFIIQLPLTPLLGYYTDNFGKRSEIMIIGSAINVIQFIIFLTVPICPHLENQCHGWYYLLPIILGGIGNSFYGAVFTPMIALTVDKSHLEMGFGVLDGVQQLGNTISPIFMGYFLEDTKKDNGFFYFFVFALILAIFQLLSSVQIHLFDVKKIFNATYKNIQKVQEKSEISQVNTILKKQSDRQEMFQTPRYLVQPLDTTSNKKKRLDQLAVQKVVAFLGILFSTILIIIIFQVQDKIEHHIHDIVFGFTIAIIISLLFFILSVFWAYYIQKQIQKSYDDAQAESASDYNHFSKVILFLGITIFTVFCVYLIAYQLEHIFFQEYINNPITINLQKLALGLEPYTNQKNLLSLIFSVILMLCFLLTIYFSYQMSCSSNTTDKFMIELLSLPLLVICFLEIEKHYDLLYLHQFKGYYDNITLKFNIIFYNALLTIVYLLGVFIFCIYYDSQSLNNFSIKIKKYSVQFKSILGFFQLFLILCTIYPAYLCLTDYRSVFQYYLEKCPSELENIQSDYVVNYSIYDKCHTKYEQEEDITCPSENPGDCFKDFNLCSKSNLQLVWEHELVKEPEQNVILACVNKSCCSVLTQIFAYPKLQYSIYCMFYIIISLPMVFFLIFFKVTTNITKQHRPTSSNIPDELGDTKIFERRVRETYLKYIFLTGRYLFIIIFVFGSIYNILTYDKHSQIPTREKHYEKQLDFQNQHNLINYNVNQNHNSIYSNQYTYYNNQLEFSEYKIEKQNTSYIQHEHESEEIYIQKILNTEIQNENEIQKELDLQQQQQNRNQNLIKTQQHKFHKSLLKQHNFQVENKQLNQIQSFSIIVHDIQSDKPIDQVQVTVFKLDEIKQQYYQCNMEFHNQPMFLYVTSENGQAIFPLEFENLNQQIKMIIFVEKKGYTGNCRIVTVTQQNIKFYQNFDIALGVNLSQNDVNSIILAEWDPQYLNDIDLYVNFGHYQGNDDTKFLCEIGVHQEQCGGVYFQGDNMVKLYGKSSESILFDKIGEFQYLVFINTYVQDLEKKINNTQNSANYGTKLSQAKPVIKYYTKNYTWPVKTILNWEDLSHLDKYVKFSILQFCIKGEKQDLRAYQIPSQYKIWSISEEGPVYDRVKTSDLPSTYNKLQQYQDNLNQQIKNITHQKDQYICSLDSLEI